MNKTIYFLLLFILLASDAVCSVEQKVSLTLEEQNYLKEKKEIRMCVDPDWEPFEVIDKDGNHVGIAADLIALAAGRVGVSIKLMQTQTW